MRCGVCQVVRPQETCSHTPKGSVTHSHRVCDSCGDDIVCSPFPVCEVCQETFSRARQVYLMYYYYYVMQCDAGSTANSVNPRRVCLLSSMWMCVYMCVALYLSVSLNCSITLDVNYASLRPMAACLRRFILSTRVSLIQLKLHMATHSPSRLVFACPEGGCKRLYTTVG